MKWLPSAMPQQVRVHPHSPTIQEPDGPITVQQWTKQQSIGSLYGVYCILGADPPMILEACLLWQGHISHDCRLHKTRTSLLKYLQSPQGQGYFPSCDCHRTLWPLHLLSPDLIH